MNVILAEHAGACYGVQRALDIARGVLADGTHASTLGPLIHNPLVVADLAERGIEPVENLDDVKGDTVVIRSHGITPERADEVSARGFRIVDATCPHVERAQVAATRLAQQGCYVLVVGEEGHPEVASLVAYAERHGAGVDVVSSPADIPRVLPEPVGVVVQTTQTKEALDAVLAELAARGIEPTVKNTICSATRDRQKAAAELAKTVDAMVVLGGRNSSNTTRLTEICRAVCPRTFHIESADELDEALFVGCHSVGVSAGASTPESQIALVIQRLQALDVRLNGDA